MTDLLTPTAASGVDLRSEVWAVDTSVPLTVTRPESDEPEFLIVSHAEQWTEFTSRLDDLNGGSMYGQFDQPDGPLFDLLVRHVGLRTMPQAVVRVGDGTMRRYYMAPGFLPEDAEPVQALNGLLNFFVTTTTSVRKMAQVAVIEDFLRDFPVPEFGSPPNTWATIGSMLARPGSFFAGLGVAEWTDQPLLIAAGGGAIALLWFYKPVIMAKRRSLGERAADRWGTELRPGDE
jgi:hypothetical protein